jgi:adenylate cyclase
MLLGAVAMKIQNNPMVEGLQYKVFDTFQRLRPRTYTPQPITILDLDNETLAKLGQWPWPRTLLADLTTRLHEFGVASVAMDIVFAEPDRTSPKNLLPLWKKNASVAHALEQLPDHDTLFAEAIGKAGNISTGFILTDPSTGGENSKPIAKAGYAIAGDDPLPYIVNYPRVVKALSIFEEKQAGSGAINNIPDIDGIIRSVPLVVRMGETLYPSLAMEALRTAQGASGYVIKTVGASGEQGFGEQTGITAIKNGDFVIPTDSLGRIWVYYTPYVKERYIPLWEVMEKDFDPARLKGHMILIGTSASGLRDIRATPLSPATSGVEVHAQLLEQILSGEYLARPDWIGGAEIVLMFVAGLILIIVMAFSSAIGGAIFTTITLVAAGAVSWYGFTEYHLLIDPVTPGLAIAIVYLACSLVQHVLAEKERGEIRNAFGHYMSPALVEQLVSNPEKLTLGGEDKELTLLFCDIRGFTSISERLDAQSLTTLLNRFLTPMSDIILSQNGTIDKYMGDCIMAFWNAPLDDSNHAINALLSAQGMLRALNQLNSELRAEGGDNAITIDIGIGLNTGRCSVGNMGSKQRFDYSALGDSVNLASRLEGLCKTYGVTTIIGEATKAKLGETHPLLEIDRVAVKGKAEAVSIYTSLPENNDFASMLNAYRNQRWDEADQWLSQFENTNNRVPGLCELYRTRINEYRNTPPGMSWDGVYRALNK